MGSGKGEIMLRSRPLARLFRLTSLASLAAAATGCFYDSSWGARKTAQLHNAARATPASLAPPAETSASLPSGKASALRVRVHATPAYAAQTPDWKSHIGVLLAQAGTTLEASVGSGLVLETAVAWEHTAANRLEGDLAALRDEDTGEGADLVLGLLGGLPLATPSFEKLGMSEVGGKHLVVRAPNVASEYDAVEKAFDELSARARAKLRQERIRHREVAVLLHEIGHALGAEHTTAAGSLMQPAYDPKMAAFDPGSIARMKRRLARGANDADAGGHAETAMAPPPAPPSPPKDDAPSDLSAGDREQWRRASELARAGDDLGAWRAAHPLFARYPLVYAVQDLRCKLAMGAFTSFDDVRAECDPLMKLTLSGEKPRQD
jgi:hypothetical protein